MMMMMRWRNGTDVGCDDYSYESLPPNFSLAANMAAGAFAGIAVCLHEEMN